VERRSFQQQFSGLPGYGIDDIAFLYPQAPPDLSDPTFCEESSALIGLLVLAFVFGFIQLSEFFRRRDWRGYVDLTGNPANYQVRKGRIGQIQMVRGDFGSVLSPAWIKWKLDTNQGLLEGTTPMIWGPLVAYHNPGDPIYLAVLRDESRAVFVGFEGPPPSTAEKAKGAWNTFTGQSKTDRWDIQQLGLSKRKDEWIQAYRANISAGALAARLAKLEKGSGH
jgi:hypothetical protein